MPVKAIGRWSGCHQGADPRVPRDPGARAAAKAGAASRCTRALAGGRRGRRSGVAAPLAGRTITVRVRFADLRAVTRSLTLSAPISATRAVAEIAEDLVRGVLADHCDEKTISLLAISVSNLGMLNRLFT